MLPSKNHLKESLHSATSSFFIKFGLLCLFFLILRIFEVSYDAILHGPVNHIVLIVLAGYVKDISFLVTISFWVYLLYFLIYLLHKRIAQFFFISIALLLCLIQLSLVFYFLTTSELLGGEIWGYSWSDIKQTAGAANSFNITVITTFLLVVSSFIWALIKFRPKNRISGPGLVILPILLLIFQLVSVGALTAQWNVKNEYSNALSVNKSYFFFSSSWQFLFPKKQDIDINSDDYIGDYGDSSKMVPVNTFTFIDPAHYPFLHQEQTIDELSAFFNAAPQKPNIVILVVEGLGRAFSNKDSYLGSFTPFLDSLSQHSLYWENFLSSGGRTFAVLPSLLGSLPFGEKGFMELDAGMPPHITLLNILKHNGYQTAFFYGGDAGFDNMSRFLEKSSIDQINDEKTFPSGYHKIAGDEHAFSWGYGDKELVKRYFDIKNPNIQQPYVHILLTLSTHNPFIINNTNDYNQRFENRLNKLGLNETQKVAARAYQKQFCSILFSDDAIRQFFSQFATRPDFNNTIFLITGDHRMPEIPMISKIDRYHVPFLIYSPLLKRSGIFSSVSTHFDITPSMLAMLKNQYGIETPSEVSWIGSGIDTAHEFRNIHAYPLMQSKNNLIDFIMGSKMINGDNLFTIKNDMNLSEDDTPTSFKQLRRQFDLFKQQNNQIINGSKLIPDSIYQRFHK